MASQDDGPRTKITKLVLDAHPLITQPAAVLQKLAQEFYTTPGVFREIKDENSRQQLILWGDQLQVKQPSAEAIEKVSAFAKLTGDFAVLSMNDVHIIALAYELEVELNGDERLRKYPGEVTKYDEEVQKVREQQRKERQKTWEPREEEPEPLVDDDGFEVVVKRRAGREKKRGKRENTKLESEQTQQTEQTEQVTEVTQQLEKIDISEQTTEAPAEEADASADASSAGLTEEYNEDDDDGDWITPENLQEELLKDSHEVIQDDVEISSSVALSTGDFACQNVSMQIGLHLMNTSTGKQIKRVRNYMYRCHACFRMTPIPKNGIPKHFCPKCGGNTLLRCAVSIDKDTGKVTPHLKRNFQWINRGNKYSVASPQSKNFQKLQGRGGYQHNKENRAKPLQDPLILREDQKEYARAVKDEQWQRRKNEKILEEWIGGGSADNYESPFTSMQTRKSAVRVGRGRYANLSKKRK